MRDRNTVVIYGLRDPRTKEVRYVGASRNIQARLAQHCAPKALRKQTDKSAWLRELCAAGFAPEVMTLETVSHDNWQAREQWWIAHLRTEGARLTNNTKGGEGMTTIEGQPCSQQRREAISRALKGHPVSARVRERFIQMRTSPDWRGRRVPIDDGELRDLYITQERSSREAAQLLSVGQRPVLRRLRELGLTRKNADAKRLQVRRQREAVAQKTKRRK